MFQIFCQMMLVSNSMERKLLIPILLQFLLLSLCLDGTFRFVRRLRRNAAEEV